MKIVHVNSNDQSGGAARAAYRLHKGLRQSGHDSRMLVAARSSNDPDVILFKKPMDRLSLVRRGLRQLRIARDFQPYHSSRPAGLELFSDDRTAFGSTVLRQLPAVDVVNLHWISSFVDYSSFFGAVTATKPIVWTIHDMNPFTGGCHYDLGCRRFEQSCHRCPQIGSQRETDLAHGVWHRKQRVFSQLSPSKLHFVSPSHWLATEVKRSALLNRFSVSVIPNGVDTTEFAPRSKQCARELLGIPQNARVLLFVAETVDNQRKGFKTLIQALERCGNSIPDLVLLSMGQEVPQTTLRFPWLQVGSVNNDRFLSMVYSAADLFAICSIQDNLPNTVLEAMACGVPVVGHAVGGIPDMVREGTTGTLVPVGDIDALSSEISALFANPERLSVMGANARRIASEEYSLSLQAQRYAALYSELIA
jgi:glycosyltransferase involved in cell wall biosynthesis